MQTGIIGLPYSGKSTILNTITGSNYETGLSATQTSPNIGVAHVPDGRLDHLTEIYKPKKTVKAELILNSWHQYCMESRIFRILRFFGLRK